eukprot:UN11872
MFIVFFVKKEVKENSMDKSELEDRLNKICSHDSQTSLVDSGLPSSVISQPGAPPKKQDDG